jgi:hypothetical protein
MKANRYVLQFHRETNKELKEMREEARNPIVTLSEIDKEVGDDYFVGYDFPMRELKSNNFFKFEKRFNYINLPSLIRRSKMELSNEQGTIGGN